MTVTVTASTSVVLVATSSNTPPYIVLLPNISTTGRLITIRDNDGFASAANSILLSTTAGAIFADGSPTIAINQPYGFVTLTTNQNGVYYLLNTFAFPAGQAAANVSNLNASSITTRQVYFTDIATPSTNIVYTSSSVLFLNSNPVGEVTFANLVSTVNGLGSSGYLSSLILSEPSVWVAGGVPSSIVAGSKVGSMQFSTDSFTWNNANGGFFTNCYNVAYGNGLFVAVGNNDNGAGPNLGYNQWSFDGSNWNNSTSPSMASTQYRNRVNYNNGLWHSVGATPFGGPRCIQWSTDGRVWNDSVTSVFPSPLGSSGIGSGITYGNGVWVASGFSEGTPAQSLVWSTDGSNWNNATSVSWTVGSVADVGFDGSRFVCIPFNGTNGNASNIATSTDGKSWSSSGITGGNLNNYAGTMSVAGNGSIWLITSGGAANVGKTMIYSTDALTWNSNTTFTGCNATTALYNPYYDGATWWTGLQNNANGQAIFYSGNGITWTKSGVTSKYISSGFPFNFSVKPGQSNNNILLVSAITGVFQQISTSVTTNILNASTLNVNTISSRFIGVSTISMVGNVNIAAASNSIAVGRFAGSTIQGNTSIAIGGSAGQQNQAPCSIAIGYFAGNTGQKNETVAIGLLAGSINQSTYSIAIGATAGYTGQANDAIAIGHVAGNTSQGSFGIAVGQYAGYTGQGNNTIAIGNAAGFTGQGASSISIGCSAGYTGQKTNSVAIGISAGSSNQGGAAIAIGRASGVIIQGDSTVAIGQSAGYSNQSTYAIGIGQSAGYSNQGFSAVAIGAAAGYSSQGSNSIGIGSSAGRISQGNSAVAIGDNAGYTGQANTAVAIGFYAAYTGQGFNTVAIGTSAGSNTQASSAVAVGYAAGSNTQGASAVAVGQSAGQSNQGASAVAIGINAGSNTQSGTAVAVGSSAGHITQGSAAVAIGFIAGSNTQGASAVAVGQAAGRITQGASAVAVGQSAGQTTQSQNSIAIGVQAGQTTQSTFAVAIGYQAGQLTQGRESIAIGYLTAVNTQGDVSIAIGTSAGNISQGDTAVAIGYQAGYQNQGNNAIAIGIGSGNINQGITSVGIGFYSGWTGQGISSISIGARAGNFNQGNNAIAIGTEAGSNTQGSNSIAIGYQAGQVNQSTNTIVINATGIALNTMVNSSFYVKPIRSVGGPTGLTTLFYSTGTGEITNGIPASDRRVKKNIENANLDTCYSTVRSLPLKYFEWNFPIVSTLVSTLSTILELDENASTLSEAVSTFFISTYTSSITYDKRSLGYIAQDVETIFPNSILTMPLYGIEDFKGLDTEQIVKMHYGATQKTMEMIENQSTLIGQLEGQVITLISSNTSAPLYSMIENQSTLIGQLQEQVSSLIGSNLP